MNINLKWAKSISDTISELGIKYICICPGSRNTPLTIAFINNSNFICSSHIDERSASFFALGISKKDNIPSVIISTSGTAIANFFPAIIESSLSKTSLIVMTADRPSYLVNSGENQTIDQENIFGDYVRKFEDFGLPNEKKIDLNNKIESLFDAAIGTSKHPPGPVHINIPFEEPLINDISSNDIIKNTINLKKKNSEPSYSDFEVPNLDDSIIICGEIHDYQSSNEILDLSKHLNAPILADPTSNIRYFKNHKNIISNYNLFLNHIKLNPKTIIRFGRKPTSKLLCELIRENKRVFYIDKYETFNDNSNNRIRSDIKHFVNHIIKKSKPITNNIYFDTLISIQEKINPLINNIHFNDYRCEGALINNILDIINPETNLFIGNSMAIREMDDLTNNLNKKINIYCNRGASGIDGLISTALGISYATRNKKESNIAILGDLSFYHDMNGLLAASKMNLNMKFVILNNNGGGIFSNMELSEFNYDEFKKFWTTPLNLDFSKIAKLYNLKYTEINSIDDLKKINRNNGKTEIFNYKIDIDISIKNKKRILEEVIALTKS